MSFLLRFRTAFGAARPEFVRVTRRALRARGLAWGTMARRKKEKERAPAPAGRHAHLDFVAGAALCLALAAWLNFSHGRIADTDSFYHYRHAWVYATEGLTHADFPWTRFSVIRTLAADLWYGLHVLMIPLTWMSNPVAALKLGSFLTTASALILFYVAQRRAGAAWPLLGTFVFLFATADLLYRATMLRPHPISLGLTLLVFADLIAEPIPSGRGRPLRLMAAAAAIAWLHLAVAWLPLMVLAVVVAVRAVRRARVDVAGAAAVGAGVVIGWLLRPHAWAALKLAYIQVAYLSLQHQGHVPLRFGRELTPFHYTELHKQLPGLLLLLAVGLLVLAALWRKMDPGIGVWTSLVLWPIFFVLAFTVFRRANEVMVAFAVTFLGLLAVRVRHALGEGGPLRGVLATWPGTLAALALAIGLLIMPVMTLARFFVFLPNAFDPDRFRAASAWIAEHSAPGDVVFSADWDRFGQLFFWNPKSHYIHGMDPIFMYAYDPKLYWKSHYIAEDKVTSFTCGDIRCNAAVGEDMLTVLQRDFQASFVLLEYGRNPKLIAYLDKAPGFQRVFDTSYEVVFRVSTARIAER